MKKRVCLLTLEPTVGFYKRFGFERTEPGALPSAVMRLEFQAGALVSSLLGNELVCMVRE